MARSSRRPVYSGPNFISEDLAGEDRDDEGLSDRLDVREVCPQNAVVLFVDRLGREHGEGRHDPPIEGWPLLVWAPQERDCLP